MLFETISTGDEIVRGRSADTNGAYMAREAATAGVLRVRHTVVGDDPVALAEAFAAAAGRADLVVTTGGLGPTEDDHTRAAAARAAGVALVTDAGLVTAIEERYRARGVPVRQNALRQAQIPAGATPLVNPAGTAPGFAVALGRGTLFCLSGVPHEMRAMWEEHVRPFLLAHRGPGVAGAYRMVPTFGKPEAEVNDRIADLMRRTDVSVGVTAEFGLIRVTVQVAGADAETRADEVEREVRARLSSLVLPAATLEASVVGLLAAGGRTLATAESCTGGLVGALLTSVPGASAVYLGGAVAYSNALKASLLGVPEALLAAHGAVSEPVARAMAEGARARFSADLAVAVTGIAGPAGGTAEKPVGLVHFALAHEGGTDHLVRKYLPDREFVRRVAANAALDMVRRRA